MKKWDKNNLLDYNVEAEDNCLSQILHIWTNKTIINICFIIKKNKLKLNKIIRKNADDSCVGDFL